MLWVCTTEVPFRSPDGSLYVQIDGVAKRSPLGILFANAYMAKIEDDVISSLNFPPHIYRRFVDDIFVEVRDEDDLEQLRLKLDESSVLNFTSESGTGNRLPFLDVEVKMSEGQHQLRVYRKLTNLGMPAVSALIVIRLASSVAMLGGRSSPAPHGHSCTRSCRS